jgi:sphinganine-1-phosphate aldolase
MYSPPIHDRAVELLRTIPWRDHTPATISIHVDRAVAELQKRYFDNEFELRKLDATFGTVAKVLVLAWVIDRWLAPAWREVWAKGIFGSLVSIYNLIKEVSSYDSDPSSIDHQFFVGRFLALPFVASKVEAELSDLRNDLSAKVAPKVFPDGISLTTVRTLPEKGRNREWLEDEWKNLKMLEKGDVDNGRVSGAVYHVRYYLCLASC